MLAVLASATVALAARGEPKDELDAKDMARARAIILKRTDLAPGFRATRTGPGDGYCAALDESALTRSGKAESPAFVQGATFVSSRADIYRTVEDAETSWRQGVSPAGAQCFREVLAGNGKLPSFRRLSFPRLAAKTFAFRLVGGGATIDLVGVQQGRAQSVTLFVSGAGPLPRAEEVALSRLVAARLAKAMGS
jgi:hypothetical protein